MMWKPDQTGTLGELVVSSAQLLQQLGTAVRDERVSAAPDARGIRYYQGLGLVERPVRYDGRKAIYGRRHLVQVLAIKALQSQGYSLAQIQGAFERQPYQALEAEVLQALGVAPASLPTELPQRPTFEVAPGVQLTIDPTLVADPQALARRIHSLLIGESP